MYKDSRNEWRWTYEASNGETIAVSSEGYVKRSDCERGIDIMKASKLSPVWFPQSLLNAV
jgi:uncharacterized protein YegP (UPF0339 family)